MKISEHLKLENVEDVLQIFDVDTNRGFVLFNAVCEALQTEFNLEDKKFAVARYLNNCLKLAETDKEERYLLFTAAEVLGQFKERNSNPLAALFSSL